MKKSKVWWLAPLLILVTLFGLFFPMIFGSSNPATQGSDPAVFNKFQADFVIDKDGGAAVTQTIDVKFPVGRRGIFEFFDIADRANPGVRYVPTVQSVTRDGKPDQWVGNWTDNKYYSIKIGNENTVLTPGVYKYQIKYTIPGVISPVTAGQATTFNSNSGTAPSGNAADQSAFYMNVIGQGWNVPIREAAVNLTLPSPATSIGCTAGSAAAGKANGPCGIGGLGTDKVSLTATSIPPNTGMTARTTMNMAPPGQTVLPWSLDWDPVLGRSVPVVILVALISLVGLLVGLRWSIRSTEKRPGFPVMYEPPQDMGPVQTHYIAYEDMGSNAITATMYYMADKGLVKLEKREDSSWLVTGLVPQEQWSQVDPCTRAFGQALGVDREGYWFLAEKSEAAGKRLLAAKKALQTSVELWAVDQGLIKSSGFEKLGRFLFWAAIILAGVVFVFTPVPSMWGLTFACFALGAVGVLATGVGTRRTQAGREMWSRAGGFERFLSTSSSEDRFDFSAQKDLFIAYIPYAVMFGAAAQWAAKYKAYTHEEPPPVPWFPYGYGLMWGAAGIAGGLGDSFESTLNSGISTYQAAQSGSGSGGGGFGGGGLGGGGGGGGGGSW